MSDPDDNEKNLGPQNGTFPQKFVKKSLINFSAKECHTRIFQAFIHHLIIL